MTPQRQILAWVLLVVLLIVATGTFSAIANAVLATEASVLVAPTVWFLLLLLVIALGSIIWIGWKYQVLAICFLLLPGFFFAFTLTHVVVSLVAGLCLLGGLLKIQGELKARLAFSFYRTVTSGSSLIILALSLIISSQYFIHIETRSWDELVPNFDLAEGTGAWILRVAGKFSPALSSLQDRNLSVDRFLTDVRPVVAVNESGQALGQGIGEIFQQAELARSRLQLSRLLGRDVQGSENINQVLSEVLRKKVVAFVSGGGGSHQKAVSAVPFFLALLLFFTLYPVGMLVFPIALTLAALVFTFFVRAGFLTVKKVPVEQEVLA